MWIVPENPDVPAVSQTSPAQKMFQIHEAREGLRPIVLSINTKEKSNGLWRRLSGLWCVCPLFKQTVNTYSYIYSENRAMPQSLVTNVEENFYYPRFQEYKVKRVHRGFLAWLRPFTVRTSVEWVGHGPWCGICKKQSHFQDECPRLLPSSPDA